MRLKKIKNFSDSNFTEINKKRVKYTTSDLKKAFGWKIDATKEWLVRGFIFPSVKATGSGTRNLFSRFDVYLTKLFVNLIKQGFSREDASAIVKTVKAKMASISKHEQILDEVLFKKEFFIIALNEKICWLSSEEELENFSLKQIMSEYQSKEKKLGDINIVALINFKKIKKEVDYCLDSKL